MTKYFISIVSFFFFTISVYTQELARRASFEAKISWPDNKTPGVKIQKVTINTPLAKAGFIENDIIIRVNNRLIKNSEDWGAILYAIKSGQETIIEVKRGEFFIKKNVQLNPLPKENNEGVNTLYEDIVTDYGIKQRVIITKPKEKTKLPAIFLVQGLSCSSVEKYSDRSNNWIKLIKDLAEKSNMVFVRIEKPGVGDSEGDCGATDFITELNGYESAVKMLKSKPYIDTTKVVVYGNSMGSAIAPYLANKYNLAGVISDGTFFKSWYEHMLEIERRILEIEGKSQKEIYDLMNMVYIPLYYKMLIEKKSYQKILEENPLYTKYHRQGLQHMYGRPMKYYHQLQDFNFAAEWEKIKVPVRIRWGTNDWIMSETDNDMIIEVLKKSGNQDYKLYKYTDLDHWSTIHKDYSSSYNFKPGEWNDNISKQIIDWVWEIIDRK